MSGSACPESVQVSLLQSLKGDFHLQQVTCKPRPVFFSPFRVESSNPLSFHVQSLLNYTGCFHIPFYWSFMDQFEKCWHQETSWGQAMHFSVCYIYRRTRFCFMAFCIEKMFLMASINTISPVWASWYVWKIKFYKAFASSKFIHFWNHVPPYTI